MQSAVANPSNLNTFV